MLSNRVIGIGSPHGDDQVGWRFIEFIQKKQPPLNAEAIAVAGATELLPYLDGCRRLAIIDGCQSGAAAGTVTRLVWPDRRIRHVHRHSTHRMTVSDTLKLAEQLGWLPAEVVLYGIEVADCSPGKGLSTAASTAIGSLAEQLAKSWAQ